MKKIVKLCISSTVVVSTLVFSGCASSAPTIKEPVKQQVSHSKLDIISYDKAKRMHEAGSALFLDARGVKLYKKGTILGSFNMPVKRYKRLKRFLPGKNAKIVTFCNGIKCEKSDELAELLIKDGFTRVMVYKGGYPEWKKKKQPLMGMVKKCDKNKGPYKPKNPLVEIAGVKVHLSAPGQIDQFWFAPLVTKGKIPAGIQMVDIRKPDQFKEGHIQGAINVPWDSKKEKIDHTKFPKGKLIVFYCNTGMMSTDARVSLNDTPAGENVLYFDANVNCIKEGCKFEPNENLD